jgi:hypothetical protein
MAKHRTHSIEFKRQVVQKFLGGESPHALAKRHGISRNGRFWHFCDITRARIDVRFRAMRTLSRHRRMTEPHLGSRTELLTGKGLYSRSDAR